MFLNILINYVARQQHTDFALIFGCNWQQRKIWWFNYNYNRISLFFHSWILHDFMPPRGSLPFHITTIKKKRKYTKRTDDSSEFVCTLRRFCSLFFSSVRFSIITWLRTFWFIPWIVMKIERKKLTLWVVFKNKDYAGNLLS